MTPAPLRGAAISDSSPGVSRSSTPGSFPGSPPGFRTPSVQHGSLIQRRVHPLKTSRNRDQVRAEWRQNKSRGLSGVAPPRPSRRSAAGTRRRACRPSCVRRPSPIRRPRWRDFAGWPELRPHPGVALGKHPPGTSHRDGNGFRSRSTTSGLGSPPRVSLLFSSMGICPSVSRK